VGVVASLGELAKPYGGCGDAFRVSMVSRALGDWSAMIRVGGCLPEFSRLSADMFDMVDTVEAVDAILVMLDVERFLEWPRPCEPTLPAVDALDRPDCGRTRSVLIWRWNLVPVAASESPGISSLT
jgi:hypothetical protein